MKNSISAGRGAFFLDCIQFRKAAFRPLSKGVLKMVTQGKKAGSVLLLIGFGVLLGLLINGRRGPSFNVVDRLINRHSDRVVVREIVDEVAVQSEVVVDEKVIVRELNGGPEGQIIIAPERPSRPVRPSPPASVNNDVFLYTPSLGRLIASLFNNLLAVGLILFGTWLIIRYNRSNTEKRPDDSAV